MKRGWLVAPSDQVELQEERDIRLRIRKLEAEISSGDKAHIAFAAVWARLKSCPETKRV
jgi:hypothetical protein